MELEYQEDPTSARFKSESIDDFTFEENLTTFLTGLNHCEANIFPISQYESYADLRQKYDLCPVLSALPTGAHLPESGTNLLWTFDMDNVPTETNNAVETPMKDSPPLEGSSSNKHIDSQQNSWNEMNSLLIDQGFSPIGNSYSVIDSLQTVLRECAKRQEQISFLQSFKQSADRRESDAQMMHLMLSKKLKEQLRHHAVHAAESEKAMREMQAVMEKIKEVGEKAEGEVKRLKGLLNKQGKVLKLTRHEFERIQGQLQDHLDKDARKVVADREAYEKIRRAYTMSKGQPGRIAPNSVAMASGSLRPIDVVRVFEHQIDSMKDDIAALQAENHLLLTQQRALENQQQQGPWTEMRQKQMHLLEEQATFMSRRAAIAEERKAALETEIQDLRGEVSLRPTIDAHESLRRQLRSVQKQLSQFQKIACSEGDVASSLVVPRPLTVGEVLARTRCGLDLTDRLPRSVLARLVQDACMMLRCKHPNRMCEAIRALITVNSSSPPPPPPPPPIFLPGERSSKGKGKRFFPDFQLYVPGPGGSVRLS